MKPVATGISRLLYLSAGWILVGLAGLGVVLPLLPTTPLLLLAAGCFLRSSERSRRWLLQSRVFGPILRDWYEHRAVRRPVKWLAVTVILVVIVFAFARDLPIRVQLAIVVLAAIGLTYLFRLPTRPATPCAPSPPGWPSLGSGVDVGAGLQENPHGN